MITDRLSESSGSGRDFLWILKNLKEVIKNQGTDEEAITALQNQLQDLAESGNFTTAEIGSALIHNLVTNGINTSKVASIRGITGPGKWIIGWYGNNVPYQYRPNIDVAGKVKTQENVLNIPAGIDVDVKGILPGSSKVVSTAGGPSIVMLSCGQPNQETQICAFWTDRSVAVLYSQNESNFPYIALHVDVDPNTKNPCLILEVNDFLFNQFPNTEIILSSWAINFTPNNNAYKFDANPQYSTKIVGKGGFSMSALTFNDEVHFDNLEVNSVAILNPPTDDNMGANKKYVDDEIAAVESNALTFKGFISTTQPAIDVREGNYWYKPAAAETTPDITFPWQVKTYLSGAWSAGNTAYMPTAGDRWANVDDDSSGWYYEGQAWHKLDFSGSAFNSNQFSVSSGEVSIKSGAIINSPTFTGTPKAPNKTSAPVNNGTLFATEGQVYNYVANNLPKLSPNISILGDQDLNNYIDAGFYSCSSSLSIINMPPQITNNVNFALIVLNLNNSAAGPSAIRAQLLITNYGTDPVYKRVKLYNSLTWSSWAPI